MEDFPRGRGDGGGEDATAFPRASSDRRKKELASEPSTPKLKRARETTAAPVPAEEPKSKKLKSKGATLPNRNVEGGVDPWRFKSLKALSSHFLGVVKEIHDLELVVSLPNNLTGFVPITEVSDLVSKAVERAALGASGADADMETPEDESSASEDGDDSSEPGQGGQGVEDEVSLPSLEALFHVGQVLRCVVTELGSGPGKGASSEPAIDGDGVGKQRRRVELSIKPSATNCGLTAKSLFEGMVLAASVLSREDHGYLMDVGIPKVSCFLHDDHAPNVADDSDGAGPARGLALGQTVTVTILTTDKSKRVITCSAKGTSLARAVVPEQTLSAAQLDALRPGLLVNARVTASTEDGIRLAFGGVFSGTVHYLQLPMHPQSAFKPVPERYKVDQKLRARILGVDLETKTVTLTLKDALVNWNRGAALLSGSGGAAHAFDGTSYRIGSVLDEVAVLRTDGANGLLVSCGAAFGFVHISRISDSHLAKIPPNKFAVGTKHKARLLGFDLCDELVQLSLQPSIFGLPFVGYWDVQPGTLVTGEILRLQPSGALVKLTEAVNGFVPTAQLSDVKLQRPDKMFKPGQKLKLRIVSVNPEARRMVLTAKKSLVQDSLPVLSSYQAAVEGTIVQGTVTKVDRWGCIVSFYANVKGLVPISELSTQYVNAASDVVKLGQSVKCRILSCDPEEAKLRLSLVLTSTSYALGLGDIPLGSIVSGKVISKTTDSAVLQLEGSGLVAVLPRHQLAEVPEHQMVLFDGLRDGSLVESLMVVHTDLVRSRLFVTRNRVMQQAVADGNVPVSFGGVKTGSVVVGFVKNVTDAGVFVSFLGDLVGYLKKQDIAVGFTGSPASLFNVGQTVAARVASVNTQSGRFSLSLVDVPIAGDLERRYVEALVEEQDAVDFCRWTKSGLSLDPRARKALELFPIGSVDTGVVKQIGAEDVEVELNNGLNGIIALGADKATVPKRGRQVLCRSLGYGKNGMRVALTSDKASGTAALGTSKLSLAIVRVVQAAAVVLEVEDTSGRGEIIFSTARSLRGGQKPLKVGQTVSVELVQERKAAPSSPLSLQGLAESKTLVLIRSRDDVRGESGSADAKRLVVDPIDPRMTALSDYNVGCLTKGRIKSIKDSQLNVVLAANLRGRVHVTEIFDSFEGIPDPARPLAHLKPGQEISCKVLGLISSKNHKYLPITHRNPITQTVVEMTVRPSDLENANGAGDDHRPPPDVSHVAVGDVLPGFIHDVKDSALWVHLSPTLQGRISGVDASEDATVVSNLADIFFVGQAVKCHVIRVDLDKRTVDLSLIEPQQAASVPGAAAVGRVVSADAVKGIVLQLSGHRYGKVALTDIADSYQENPTQGYAPGDVVRAVVVEHDSERHHLDLSLRTSRLRPTTGKPARDPEVASVGDLEVGQDIRGYIVNVTDKGAFVALGRHVTARLKISEISHDFVKDWQSLVKVGQLVAGKVISVDLPKRHVEFSIKAGDAGRSGRGKRLGWSDLEKGMKVDGVVTKVESFGVFIRVDDSQGISGLCHISELADVPVKQIDKLYQVGDAVRAIILKVDETRKRVSFGLKSTYFEEELGGELSEEEDKETGGEEESVGDDSETRSHGSLGGVEEVEDWSEDDGGGEPVADAYNGIANRMDSASDSDQSSEDGEAGALETSHGFVWDAKATRASDEEVEADASADDDQGEDRAEHGKSRRAKRRSKRELEEEISRKEEEMLDPNRAPQSADDFERFLLGSPSSSYIWVKYMAFHLQLGEVERAREVAERALQTIHFREEAEKLNVWIAYLNLENAYGTQDKLDAVFARACQYNDSKDMHLRMVAIYEQSGKDQLAEALYEAMAKKFKESSKVWIGLGLFYIKRGKIDESRKTLQRAIQSLAKRKHIETIVKFAQMEFRFGEPERGRTILESVVSTYPKRLDIWSIYLDMEQGSKARPGEPERVRRLFERMTNLQLSSKRARDIFKRWLEWEKKQPNGQVDHVKKKALEFVENLAAR
ncbi:hypothetical protein DFJ74DRAFT_696109 [Hyaloraphidium curvatum]|nr:hypothetical protein DFJ74DRAFT_696109 [Hyaloraphidium curvatum]